MIELTKPQYGKSCNNCFSDEDVKEMVIRSNGQGVAIRLCAKCRRKLLLLLDNDMKRDRFQYDNENR